LLSESVTSITRDADFIFENTPVRVMAIRSTSGIQLAGLNVGPFEEGNEYQVKFWVAQELERAGIVRIRGDMLDLAKLYKIQWVERVQSVSQLSTLPKDFYPKLRRLLADLRESSRSDPQKLEEYEHARRLSQDVVNCRLKKIVSLASTPGQKSQVLKNLTVEEREFYERLNKIITDWRDNIIEMAKEP